MNIEQAFQLELMETTTLTTIIQNRAYYVKAPIDVDTPYVVIHSISNIPVRPYFASATGKEATRIQVSIFATTYTSCKAISVAIKTGLDGFSGTMGTTGVVVGGCFYDNEYDLSFEDSPLLLYGVGIDFIIHH